MFNIIPLRKETKTDKVLKSSDLPLIFFSSSGYKIKFNTFATDVLDIKLGDYVLFFQDDITLEYGIAKSNILQRLENGNLKFAKDKITNEQYAEKFGYKIQREKINPIGKQESLFVSSSKMIKEMNKKEYFYSYYLISETPNQIQIETVFGKTKLLVFPISFYKEIEKRPKTYRDL